MNINLNQSDLYLKKDNNNIPVHETLSSLSSSVAQMNAVKSGKVISNDTATFTKRITADGKMYPHEKYSFTLVENPTGNPYSLGYYEQVDFGKFKPTSDTEVTSGKEYFICSIDTTSIAQITKLQGNAVAWNQLVQNGDFSDGTTNWFGDEISTSVSGGKMTVTYTQSNGRLRNTINWVVGHKYYACVTATSSTATTIHVELDFGWNQFQTLCQSNTRTFCHGFLNATEQGEFNCLQIFTDEANTITVENVMVIDLTLLFGVGNEPSTVADFETWLANNIGTRAYYPYNAGELIPCNLLGIKTVGFNQWDEETRLGYWEATTGYHEDSATEQMSTKDLIPVFGDTKYFIRMPIEGGNVVVFYDANRNYISYTFYSFSSEITTPSNARFMGINFGSYGTTYNHDICINISNVSKNGTYEPYWEQTTPFDMTKLYGKLNGSGDPIQLFPNGMRSVGSVHDVVDLENGTADVKVGSRAYSSGDEEDTTVITDMVKTFYPLATPLHYTDVVYRDGGVDIPISELNIKVDCYGTEEELLTDLSNSNAKSCATTMKILYK